MYDSLIIVQQNDALDSINSLVENVGEFEPEVQMLVCDSCSSEDGNGGLSRLNGEWSVIFSISLASLQWVSIEMSIAIQLVPDVILSVSVMLSFLVLYYQAPCYIAFSLINPLDLVA